MVLVLVLVLLVGLAVASVRFGVDSRPIGRAKWGDEPTGKAPVSRW
jgi:hypothetical protein